MSDVWPDSEGRHAEGNIPNELDLLLLVLKFITQCVLVQCLKKKNFDNITHNVYILLCNIYVHICVCIYIYLCL